MSKLNQSGSSFLSLHLFNINLDTVCLSQVSDAAVSTLFESTRRSSPSCESTCLREGMNRYEVNLEDLCTCFGLDHGIKQLRNIKINQPYMEGHTPAHMPAAWQRLKAKRGGLFLS